MSHRGRQQGPHRRQGEPRGAGTWAGESRVLTAEAVDVLGQRRACLMPSSALSYCAIKPGD